MAKLSDLLVKKSALSHPDRNLDSIRRAILSEPVSDAQRPLLWKILLRLSPDSLEPRRYAALISKDPSAMIAKIRNDAFRTLGTDQDFQQKVGQEKLVRLLEAFVWKGPINYYVQGNPVLSVLDGA